MATLVGKTVGKYQVVERLGRGGMAAVYKAYHPQLERYAAIKVLHGHLIEGQDFLARFQREAKAIAALQHPNIVQVYDFDVKEEYYYMVMEFIDGGSLKDLLTDSGGTLPISGITHIVGETAAALDYAHRQGVIHRDIKPANVLLSKEGRVVLTDFGIARIMSDTQFTTTGALVGTPAYMSPEQGKGLTITPSSDIYSLGVILYELITGQPPFDADTPLSLIYKHINAPLTSPRLLRKDISPALEKVMLTALAKEPQDRFSAAGEMSQAIEKAVSQISKSETMATFPKEEEPPSEEIKQKSESDIYEKGTVAMEPEEALEPTLTSQPAVAMEAGESPGVYDKATMAMGDGDTPAEIPSAPPDGDPPPVSADAPPDASPPADTPPSLPPQREKSSPTRQIKPLTIALSAAGVVLLALFLIFGLPKLLGGADCTSLPDCQNLADERMGAGDFNAAVDALDAAVDYVPRSEHPENAHLWCLRGEALEALGQIGDALHSFEECLAWTEDDPGLEDTRMFAEDNIMRLEE